MTEANVIPAGGGEIVGDAPDRRVEILSDHEALNATWSRFGAGRDGADLHVHYEHTDFFYVLEGELTMRLGREGEEATVPVGSLVRVPPRVIHGFRNGSDAEVRYLNFHAPGVGFADYMRSIRDGSPRGYDQFDPPPDGERPHADVTIGPPPASTETIAIAELAAPPPPTAAAEWLYVLDGEVTVAGVAAVAGAWAHVPEGVEGEVAFDGPARVLYLRHASS
jgi:mannose-6-phosphate isomerase-like protein (cupin superfamily)